MTEEKDIFIINDILAGKLNSFTFLVEKYKDMVFTISFNLINQKEEAEEIAQDVFLKVFKSLDKFKKKSKFSTWLYRITYNECISRLRKKKVFDLPINKLENSPLLEIKDEDNWKNEEYKKRELTKALQKIPESDRTIILLHYYESLGINEISEITDLSQSNVKIKLFRARQKLHNLLKTVVENEFVNE